jgi:hypothetical protein
VAATKLRLYNAALRLCKERKLATLTDNREGRRLLDEAWGDGATNGSVRRCLEMGQWTFATRTAQIDYSPSVAPTFGYRYAFEEPEDFVRLAGIYEDEFCHCPLTQYSSERAYWYCDLQTIYVQYISNHADYGADLSLWSENFAKTVEADLAHEIVGNLTQGREAKADVVSEWQYWKKEAGAFDAMNRPTKRLPPGSWIRARTYSGHRNRWNGEAV